MDIYNKAQFMACIHIIKFQAFENNEPVHAHTKFDAEIAFYEATELYVFCELSNVLAHLHETKCVLYPFVLAQ